MQTLEELAARIDDLERELRATQDVQAIHALKARYGQLADSRYTRRGVKPKEEVTAIAAQIAELFTEDAVWDGGAGLGECRGREAITARFAAPTLQFSWHYFVKPNIEVDGDTARGTWDILAPCTSAAGEAMWMAGFEEDEYRRVGGHWLHSRMQLSVVFMAPHDRGWAPRRG